MHLVVNISQKSVSLADVWKCHDSVLGQNSQAANSKSTGPQAQSAEGHRF